MSIMRDLENLLREIAEQQQGQGRPAAQRPAPPRPAPQPAPQPRPAPPRPAQQRPLPSRSAPEVAEVLDAEIVDEAPVRRRAAVAKHVEQHLDTSDLTAHAAQVRRQSRLGRRKGRSSPAAEVRPRTESNRRSRGQSGCGRRRRLRRPDRPVVPQSAVDSAGLYSERDHQSPRGSAGRYEKKPGFSEKPGFWFLLSGKESSCTSNPARPASAGSARA